MNVDRGSVRSVLANRAIVGGVVFTLIGVLSSFFLGVVFAGFWLAVGVSLLVGEFVDRLVGAEDRGDPTVLSDTGGGVVMVLFGASVLVLFAVGDFPSPIEQPFGDMTPGSDFGRYSNVPAIFGWALPALFGLWGVFRLSGIELGWRERLGLTSGSEDD